MVYGNTFTVMALLIGELSTEEGSENGPTFIAKKKLL